MFYAPKFIDRWLRSRDVIGPETSISPLTRRSGLAPVEWFVDAQRGSDTSDGRDPRSPKATLATLIGNGASSLANSGDTVYVVGNVTEEITGYNLLEDISIIGVANRPRHADKARDYATYAYKGISGASWREAASHGATTPLLTIRGQGWYIENILFVPPSDAAAIYLERNALSNISEFDASHLQVRGCRFAGGSVGIQDVGGGFGVHLYDNVFQSNTHGIRGTSTSVDVPTQWHLRGNVFMDCTNSLIVSAKQWLIMDNVFGKFTTTSVDLINLSAQGSNNEVHGNYLSGDYDAKYIPSSTDEWAGNYSMDVGSAEVGAEGLTTAIPVA